MLLARRPHVELMSTPEPGFAPNRVGVAVVDADPLAREGLSAIIAAEDNLSLLQETAQVNSILASGSRATPDVIFVEAGLASEDAGAVIRTLPPVASARAGDRLRARKPGGRGLPRLRGGRFGIRRANRDPTGSGDRRSPRPIGAALRSAGGRALPRAAAASAPAHLSRKHRAGAARAGTLECGDRGAARHLRRNGQATRPQAILAKLGVEDRAQAAVVALERGFARVN